MLQHMLEVKIFHFVFGGMNLVVGILEIALNHKRGRISCLRRRCMIGTSVSALCQDVRNGAVLIKC